MGIIPARYASTRFPGKPLTMILGKPMIQRTYEQAKKVRAAAIREGGERPSPPVRGEGGERGEN